MNTQNDTTNVAQASTAVKAAVIWARVSTSDQAETSLPDQVSRCQDRLKQAGYSAIHTLQVDWSSMDLYSCPEFQELQRLISNREVQALVVYERDRLSALPMQRLLFLSELKENGVELLTCSGPPVIEGSEGVLIEHVLAIAKEKQVQRARQGARDGMRYKVKSGKPAMRHRLYGYKWEKDKSRLLPDENWNNLKSLFDMLLEGGTYNDIKKEFKKRGILTPTGKTDWNGGVLSAMIRNPVYAGRYYAIKRIVAEPKKRRTKGYGNSSYRTLPLDEAYYVPSIEIVNPPITWEQRGYILDQIARHQTISTRNAKREYFLRGRIFCMEHHGVRGEELVYRGATLKGKHHYRCQVGGCRTPYLSGAIFESTVKSFITLFFSFSEDEFYKSIVGTETRQAAKAKLEKELKRLELDGEKLINTDAQLEDRYLNGHYTDNPETYERLKLRYKSQRQTIRERQDRILTEMAQLGRDQQVFDSFEYLKHKFIGRLLAEIRREYPNGLKWTEEQLKHPEYQQMKQIFDDTAVRAGKEPGYFIPPSDLEKLQAEPLTDGEWQQLLLALDVKLYIHNEQTAEDAGPGVMTWNVNAFTRSRKGRKHEKNIPVLVDMRMALPLKADADLKKVVSNIGFVQPCSPQ